MYVSCMYVCMYVCIWESGYVKLKAIQLVGEALQLGCFKAVLDHIHVFYLLPLSMWAEGTVFCVCVCVTTKLL